MILSAALKNHINTAEGPHELIYKETQKLLDYLSFNRRRTKKLNSEKYTAVFKYLKQELEADITGGTPGMMVHEGSIVFQLVNPTPKYKNESTD
mgnify:FL=1